MPTSVVNRSPRRTRLGLIALMFGLLLGFATTAQAQPFDLYWNNAAGDNNLLNQQNWLFIFMDTEIQGGVPPLGNNLIFDGTRSNANANFIPRTGFNEDNFFSNSLQMINGYSGTIRMKSTEKNRITDPPESAVQDDNASWTVNGNVTINSGQLIIENSSFTPAVTDGLIKVDSLFAVIGSLNLNGGRLRIKHLTFDDSIEMDSDARVFVQGDFNWSGGVLQFDAVQGEFRKKASMTLGGNWNQTINTLIAIDGIVNEGLLGRNGMVSLAAQPEAPGQAVNVNGGGSGTAIFPALVVGTKTITIAGNDNIYCYGEIEDSSLIVSSQLVFNNGGITTNVEGAVGVGPFQDAELRLGNSRTLSSSRNIAHGGGTINATGSGSRILADGGYTVDDALFQGPFANPEQANPTGALNVTGSGTTFRVRSFDVLDAGPTMNYSANFNSNTYFQNYGGESGSVHSVEGVADVNLPYYVYLGGSYDGSAKPWIATDEVDDLGYIYGYWASGPLRLQNPLSIVTDYLVNGYGARIQIIDGRSIDVTNGEIHNQGYITITDGSLLRPTNSLYFSNSNSQPKNSFVIDEDYVYAVVKDSDKNLNGFSRDRLPYVKMEIFSGGIFQEIEEFDFGISGSYRNTRFRETGNYNWTFRNYYAMPLTLRDKDTPSVSNNGVFAAIGGDTIRMTYIDPNGSGGPQVVEVTVTGGPGGDEDSIDLSVVEDSFSVSNTATESKFELEVQNSGTIASGAFTVGFYRDRDPQPTTSDTPDFTAAVSSIPAGGKTMVSFTAPAPADGFYSSWALVDSAAAVTEASEENNFAGPVVYGTGPEFAPDLIISEFIATAVGTGVEFSMSVTNQGNAPSGSAVLTVNYDTAGPNEANPVIPGLPASATYSLKLNGIDITPGTYTASALIDSGGTVEESDETNNGASSNQYTTDNSTGGNRMTFSTIRANNVPIEILSPDVTGRTDGNTDFSRTFPTSMTEVGVIAPEEWDGLAFQGWFDAARSESLGSAPDINIPIIAGRSARAIYQALDSLPDLVVDQFTAEAAGGNITFTMRVTNYGIASSAVTNVALYYNRAGQGSPGGGDVVLAVNALAPNASQTIQHVLASAPEDTYTPVAFVDAATIVAESSETNNTTQLTEGNGSLAGGGAGGGTPDLTITSFVATPLGQGVLYTFNVRNAGDGTAGSSTAGVDFTSDASYDATVSVPSLAAGAEHPVAFAWSNAPLGTFQSTVGVDVTGVVTESNEGNNTAQTGAFELNGLDGTTAVTFSSERVPPTAITIDTIDATGQYGGDTQFARYYLPGVNSVQATAPATSDGNAFVRWYSPATGTTISTSTTATIPVVPGQLVRVDYAANGENLPDLVINRFEAAVVGRNITFTVEVANVGDAASAASNLALYYQLEGVTSPAQGDQNTTINALAPGATQVVQFTYNNAVAGKYFPAVLADWDSQVAESSEINNWAYRTDGGGGSLEITQPDLTIETFFADAYGAGVTYEVLVRNIGTATSPANTLAISPDSGPGQPYAAVVPALEPGGFVLMTLYRLDAAPGNWTAVAVVDRDLTIDEIREDNNTLASNQHSTVAVTGGNLLTIAATNADLVPIAVDRADLTGRTDGSTTFARLYGDDISTVELTAPAFAGNSQAFVRWFDPTTNSVLGTGLTINAEVRPGALVRAEYAGPNPPAPDLTINSFEALMNGSSITFNVVVQNAGNAAAGASRLNIDHNPTAGSPTSQFVDVAGFAAGETRLVQMVFNEPNAGNYTPIAFIDSLDAVAESAESNNTSTLTGGQFNLTVVPTGARQMVYTSANASDVPVTVSFADLGGASSGVTQFARLYDPNSPDALRITAPATHQGRNFVRWYDSAKEEVLSTSPSTFVTVRDGRALRAEYETLTGGGNEGADLVIDWMRAELLGNGVIFWAQVRNVGNQAAGAFDLAFFWDHPGFPTSGAGSNATVSFGGLAAGATNVGMAVWSNTPEGFYTPWAFVDSGFTVSEVAEDNNSMALDSESLLIGGNGDSDGSGSGTGAGNGDTPGDGGGNGGGIDVVNGSGDRVVFFEALKADSVPITITEYDSFGLRDGTTNFYREYTSRTEKLTVSAPASHEGNNFLRWLNGSTGTALGTNPTLLTNAINGTVLIAEYDGNGQNIGGGPGNGPDLIVENLQIQTSGDDTRWGITIRNGGNQPTTATNVALYINPGGAPTGASPIAGSGNVPALTAGERTTVTVDIFDVTPTGPFEPWVWVDQQGTVTELSETNNKLGGPGFTSFAAAPVSGIVAY